MQGAENRPSRKSSARGRIGPAAASQRSPGRHLALPTAGSGPAAAPSRTAARIETRDPNRLVAAAVGGDDRPLRARAYRLLGNAYRMDDALHEAYVKAYRALPDFRGSGLSPHRWGSVGGAVASSTVTPAKRPPASSCSWASSATPRRRRDRPPVALGVLGSAGGHHDPLEPPAVRPRDDVDAGRIGDLRARVDVLASSQVALKKTGMADLIKQSRVPPPQYEDRPS